jgi:hypothetical protein
MGTKVIIVEMGTKVTMIKMGTKVEKGTFMR